MATPAVPRSWVWHARFRAGVRQSGIALGPVGFVSLGPETAGSVVLAFGIGVVLVVLLIAVRGPSPTEVAVAGALCTGEPPADLSLALVDTEAAARLRGRGWARFAWVGALALIALGTVLLLGKDVTTLRVTHWALVTVMVVAWSWELTASAREAVRWRAGADERWAAWTVADGAVADGASAG